MACKRQRDSTHLGYINNMEYLLLLAVCLLPAVCAEPACKTAPHPDYPDQPHTSCQLQTQDDVLSIPTDASSLQLQFPEGHSVDLSAVAVSLPRLEWLALDMTHLSREELRAALAGLATPALTELKVLRDLDVDASSLYLLDSTFGQRPSLVDLNLRGTGIGVLDPSAFSGLGSISELDLSENYLGDIPEAVFMDCVNLTFLNLQNNFLAPDSLRVNSFIGPRQLTWLNLDGNRLTSIPAVFEQLPHLSTITLNHNGIADLSANDLRGLTGLHNLFLANNLLKAIPASLNSQVPHLSSLDLSHNDLTDIPDDVFLGLTHLEHLYLPYTSLSSLRPRSFNGLSSLRELQLNGNQLTSINSTLLASLGSLTSLNLAENSIDHLPPDAFSVTPGLEVLQLQGNRLQELEEGLFDNLALQELYLTNNPWHCDCSLLWLFEWIHEHQDELSTEEQLYEIKCAAPEHLRRYNFFDLRFPNVLACEMTTVGSAVEGAGGLSMGQWGGVIGGILVFLLLIIAAVALLFYFRHRKNGFWRPPGQRAEQPRQRTPSWCIDPPPYTPAPAPQPEQPTPEQQNEKNEGFDNPALESSMHQAKQSPTKPSSPSYTVPSPVVQVGPADSNGQAIVDFSKSRDWLKDA